MSERHGVKMFVDCLVFGQIRIGKLQLYFNKAEKLSCFLVLDLTFDGYRLFRVGL